MFEIVKTMSVSFHPTPERLQGNPHAARVPAVVRLPHPIQLRASSLDHTGRDNSLLVQGLTAPVRK